MLKPCLSCGSLIDQESRCSTCAPQFLKVSRQGQHPSKSSSARGYGTQWRYLSERARRIQPWCSQCGTSEDLTTDHSPEAWAAKAKGRPITLRMVDVLCRPCNAAKGAAREQVTA